MRRKRIDAEKLQDTAIVMMKHPLMRSCPICESSEGKVLHSQSFVLPDASPLPQCYDVIHCPVCGFCFADTVASQEEYTRYYRSLSKYEEDVHLQMRDDTPDRKRYRNQAQTLARLSESKQARILDVGCARGGLLDELAKIGFSALTGLDPAENCIRHVRSLGIGAFQGDVFDLGGLRGQMFDIIILSGVLEHIKDIQQVPEIIADLLHPTGFCYIEVPNAADYASHPIAPYYYFDCEHINHFDDIALDNLFLRGGFQRADSANSDYPMPHSTYPSLYCIYRRGENAHPLPLRRTENIVRAVYDHLAWSETSPIETVLAPLAQSGAPLVVWGAGQMTMRLLATTSLRNCNILFFVDNDCVKHRSAISGLPVFPPESLRRHSGPILVASVHFADDIIGEIRRAGFENQIVDLGRCGESAPTKYE